jgi:WD40 repeat protein
MVYTPDGKSLVSCDRDKGVQVLDVATGKELRRFETPGDSISCFALAPDGKTIVTRGWSGSVLRQWDLATGQELRQIVTGDKGTSVLALAPDGKTLAAVTGQTLIRVWDVPTWQEIHRLAGHTRWIGSLAFLTDGKTLLSGGGITHTLGTALSADGRKAALVDAKGVLHVWDLASGKVWCRIHDPAVARDRADFSPDGKLLVVKHQDDILRVWETQTGMLRYTLPHVGTRWQLPHAHVFSPDGGVLTTSASAMDQSVIHLWETATGKELGTLTWQDRSFPESLAFSADGKCLVSAHLRHGMDDKIKEEDIGLRL